MLDWRRRTLALLSMLTCLGCRTPVSVATSQQQSVAPSVAPNECATEPAKPMKFSFGTYSADVCLQRSREARKNRDFKTAVRLAKLSCEFGTPVGCQDHAMYLYVLGEAAESRAVLERTCDTNFGPACYDRAALERPAGDLSFPESSRAAAVPWLRKACLAGASQACADLVTDFNERPPEP